MKKETFVVNLFAPPGCGKSTMMADVFSELKWRGVNCEQATEFAKEICWEERHKTLTNQIYIFGKQQHRINRLVGKVDVVVTDSPFLLSLFYKQQYKLDIPESFDRFALDMFNKYNNLNYYIERKKIYNPAGRMQTEQESKDMDGIMYNFLNNSNIKFVKINGDRGGVDDILSDICLKLQIVY